MDPERKRNHTANAQRGNETLLLPPRALSCERVE